MTATPTAHWPLPSLLRSLSRAGWGDLAGRAHQGVRSTLLALANRLPDRGAAGLVTAEQVAAAAGLSERWVRRCMTVLEDAGVIEWQRGGVIDGRPAPSMIRIVKDVLVNLIHAARGDRAKVEAAHRAKTQERIRSAGLSYTMRPPRKTRGKQTRRSAHAELSASLSTPKGGLPIRGESPALVKDTKMVYKNLSLPDEQVNALERQVAHEILIQRKRQVAEDTRIRQTTNSEIRATQQALKEAGQDADFKAAAIALMRQRFYTRNK